MNAIQLEATRKEIFREILDENNEVVLSKVAAYIHEVRKANSVVRPCCFTDEEKLTRLEQSVRDVKAGLGIAHEEMFNRHPEWL